MRCGGLAALGGWHCRRLDRSWPADARIVAAQGLLRSTKLPDLPRLDRDTDEEIPIGERRWCGSGRDGHATRFGPPDLVARDVGLLEHHQPASSGGPNSNGRPVEDLSRNFALKLLAGHLDGPLFVSRGRQGRAATRHEHHK